MTTKDEALKLVLEALEDMHIVDFSLENLAGWNKAITSIKQALAAPVQKPVNLHQVLTDPENQPNQYGIEFGMHGEKMMFKVGVQQFALDYEPDTQDEFNFMRDMLIHAFSTFTHDVKITPPAAQRQWVGLTGQQKNLIARISVDVFDAIHRTEAKLKEKND